MDLFDDVFSMTGGSRAIFTEEEIETARKLQKKTGRTILETLTQMTGKTMPSMSDMNSLNRDLADLSASLQADFGISPSAGSSSASSDVRTKQQEEPEPKADPVPVSERFAGTAEAAAARVYGQDELLRSLTVAFKRPFVLPEEEGHPRNVFYVTGPEDTGRHTALKAVARELADRGILSSPEIRTMDLSAYSAADSENVFLQDLYAALSGAAQVILFENFAACHNACCAYLSRLAIDGSCRLSGRYMLQNGQLVSISSSFVSNAVSSFSAAGKYLVFIGTGDTGKLADVFGAPLVNALGDVCRSVPLTEESFRRLAEQRWQELCDTARERLGFALSADTDALLAEAVRSTERGAGAAGLNSWFTSLRKALAAIRLERDLPQDLAVSLTLDEQGVRAVIGEESFSLSALLPRSYTGQLDAVKREMDAIVGLKNVKDYILSLEEYHSVQKQRREAGLKASEVSKHMVFTGNPGTGKTTIARIVSRYLKAIGVLSGGQLVEVSRADLVGRYVGHTAPLTNQVIQSALGGVLFIDEAYSLYRGKDDSFGLEAIDTLVKGMEDHRDDLVVILAGYSKEMHTFLEANSGLKSRFPNWIDFPDYTPEELLAIAKSQAASRGYTIEEAAFESLLAFFTEVQAHNAAQAGNGRLVRNKLEEAILNQSRRLAVEPGGDLSILLAGDFDLTGI